MAQILSTVERKKNYLDRRRTEVEAACAEYYLESCDRLKKGDPEPYKYGFDNLANQTNAFVKREAAKWAYRCKAYRLYADDFESDFRFKVASSALNYPFEKNGKFFDYLRKVLANAALDLIRSAKTKKNAVNHMAKSLDRPSVLLKYERNHHVPSPEQDVLSSMMIEEMANEPTLAEEERQMFRLLSNDPEMTLQELADELGLKSRMQASRTKERLARKLQKYRGDCDV